MGVIAKRIGGSPRMTDPCELANAIPGAVTTGESAPRQHRVEECDGHQAAVLIQGSSRCPGRLARAGPARQARRLTLQCHPRRVAQRLPGGLYNTPRVALQSESTRLACRSC